MNAETLLASMLSSRLFEERCAEMVSAGQLDGTVLHVSIGQEAIAVGTAAHRRDGDLMFSTHRGVAHCIAWNADLEALLAESIGRRGGYARGLAGHMHIIDLDNGIAATNGIVGGGVPLAVGAALQLRRRGEGNCVIGYFGDGAANTGAVAEALNLAQVWEVPALFVCENNEFAEMTWSVDFTAGRIVDRAIALGMTAEQVNGNDVMEIYDRAGALIEGIRNGAGPALLECTTFRAGGHWLGDPEHYREAEHKDSFPDRDPIPRLAASAGIEDDEVERIKAEIDLRLEPVFESALAMEPPTIEDILRSPLAP